jgi:uncharacterized repeat protein (TIGR02543 family)
MKLVLQLLVPVLCVALTLAACDGAGAGGSYTVTYDPNGAGGGTVPSDSRQYSPSQLVFVKGRSDLVLNNNSFQGWNTESNGSGTTYREDDFFTMGMANVTLYAQWEPVSYSDLFQAATTGLRDLSVSAAAFADVDGDDDRDLAMSGADAASGIVTLLYGNNGDGDLDEELLPVAQRTQGSLGFGDANGDGGQDLVVTGYNGTDAVTAELYLNDGNGNFEKDSASSPNLTGVEYGATGFSDLDGDGYLDLVLIGDTDPAQGSALVTPTARLYDNDGSGTLIEDTTESSVLDGAYRGSIRFADIDADNDIDIMITAAAAPGAGTTKLYENGAAGGNEGEFQKNAQSTAESAAVFEGGIAGAFIDLEGDGDPDYVEAGFDVRGQLASRVYTNDGAGTFAVDTSLSSTIEDVDGASIGVADVDLDGDTDILLNGTVDVAHLYVNDGTGGLTLHTLGVSATDLGTVDFADVDGDGDSDLLVTGDRGTEPSSTLYVNTLSD